MVCPAKISAEAVLAEVGIALDEVAVGATFGEQAIKITALEKAEIMIFFILLDFVLLN